MKQEIKSPDDIVLYPPTDNDLRNEHVTSLYSLMADLWCNPQDVDIENVRENTWQLATAVSGNLNDFSQSLKNFLKEEQMSEEDYIELFELNPDCSLYLGSHVYEEPKTCANSGVSDRNKYMIDLIGIYKHFGQSLDGKEMPDFLPLMLEFLSLTSEQKEDTIRVKFAKEYFLPFLPPLRKRLEELNTHYLFLLDAVEKLVNYEFEKHFKQPSN